MTIVYKLNSKELRGKSSYEEAVKMNVLCRINGITVRSTIDLLIAQTAIENEIMLLTWDSDFKNLSKVVPEFKLFEV